MLDGVKQAAALRDVKDRFHAALESHERESHDGRRCTANVLAALAYLAHTLGVKHDPAAGQLGFFADRLAEYNEQCPDPVGCGHYKPHDPDDREQVAGYATPVPGRRASDTEVEPAAPGVDRGAEPDKTEGGG